MTIDECMCSWQGADGKYIINGMLHVTKIKRKPKGIGAEFKSLACAESGLLLRFKVV